MERGIRPWLTFDWIYQFSTLGRENQRCVKALHAFTNQVIISKIIVCFTREIYVNYTQVIRDRREALKREAKVLTDCSINNNVQELKYDEPSISSGQFK